MMGGREGGDTIYYSAGHPSGAEMPIFRGGGWDNFAPYLRTTARYYYYDTSFKANDIGFRVAREAQ